MNSSIESLIALPRSGLNYIDQRNVGCSVLMFERGFKVYFLLLEPENVSFGLDAL